MQTHTGEYQPYKPVFGSPIVTDYEVLQNAEGQLAFFVRKNLAMDSMDYSDDFWFNIHKDQIIIGGCTYRVAFSQVPENLLDIARRNQNLLLVEIEGQDIVRTTPCRFSSDIQEDGFSELGLA